MKRKSAAIAVLFLCLFSCRRENPSNGDKGASSAVSTSNESGGSAFRDTAAFGALLANVLALENAIWSNREDPNLAGPLLAASFDTVSGCFFTVGKGVINPAHPEVAQREGQKLASRRSAEYWALYLKAWRKGKRLPFNRQVSGKISYSTVIFERVSGDTLYTLMQTPHGSIILDEAPPGN